MGVGRSAAAVGIFLVANILAAVVVSLLFPDIESSVAGAIDLVTGLAAAAGYWHWSDPKRRKGKEPQMRDLG